MRNVSSEYRKTMERRQDFYFEAEISFQNGDRKTLKKDDFSIPGNSVVESAGSSSFPLGVVCSKQLLISIINDDDKWSEYDFYYAKIFLKIKFDLDNGTTETLNIGTFTVITPETYGVTIELAAMDDGYKLDKDYSTGLTYPLSLGAAFRDSCSTCGVSVLTSTIPNEHYMISKQPENITHRQFVGLCAMIAGGNAGFDEYNRLKFLPYDFSEFEKAGLDGGKFDSFGTGKYQTGDSADGGSFYPWKAGYEADGGVFGDRNNVHILYDFKNGMKVGVDDVVITGVQIADKDKNVFLYGSEGYVLSLENQLAEGREEIVSGLIGEKIVGLRFRPFTGDHISYPLAEFMDLAYIFDEKNNMYQTILTDVDFQCYGFTTLKCSADSPIRNSSKYYGNETKAIVAARQETKRQISDYDIAVRELSSMLANSMGMYETYEALEDGSRVKYQHDKPTLEESKTIWKKTGDAFAVSTDGGKTWNAGMDSSGKAVVNVLSAVGIRFDWAVGGILTLGGQNNVNGSLSIINSNRTQTGVFNNEGIKLFGTEEENAILFSDGGMSFFKDEIEYAKIDSKRFAKGEYEGVTTRIKNGTYTIARNTSSYDETPLYAIAIEIFSGNAKNNHPNGTGANVYFGESVDFGKPVNFFENIIASKTKSRVVDTKNYENRLLYCYEMPSPIFGDCGEGETDESGECLIALDDIFSETVNSFVEYQVFLQKEGMGDLWVEEKTPMHFSVKGTKNLKFSWEIKMRQKDYEFERLEAFHPEPDETEIDYEALYMEEIERLIFEQEEILYETT